MKLRVPALLGALMACALAGGVQAQAGAKPLAVKAYVAGDKGLHATATMVSGEHDMVLIDARKKEYPQYLEQAIRLVRVGGVIAIDNALWHSRVPDPAQRDPDTTAVRSTLKAVKENESLEPLLLAAGDGLLIALRTA